MVLRGQNDNSKEQTIAFFYYKTSNGQSAQGLKPKRKENN